MRRLQKGPALAAWVCFAILPAASADETVLDPARAKADAGASTLWYDARDLEVEGKGWSETKGSFDRLPAKAEGVVPATVWNLSRQSAGLCIRFTTDATTIQARWTLTSKNLALPHMPSTGVSGVDLYVKAEDGRWRWLAIGIAGGETNVATLAAGIPEGKREYRLYLPLYNGVTSLEIGIPKDRRLARPDTGGRPRGKPVVFYGTSITQGGCASRPGMTHPAILGRRLDRPVINLGFSGSGRMEPALADLLAELDPAVYVLDCLPNLAPAEVEARIEPFVRALRKAHPTTPILLAEDRTYDNAFLVTGLRQLNEGNRAALRAAYDRLKSSGVPNLHYLEGGHQLGVDGEASVDGSHPTDLGFMRMAAAFGAALEPILQASK